MILTLRNGKRLSLSSLPAGAVAALLVGLLLGSPAAADVPRHQPGEPAAASQAAASQDLQTPAEEGLAELSKSDTGGPGLEEHLGAYIPLDLVFRDEQGNPVRLGDLVNKPTVIAPVYYRCPNVCHFLQGELARVLPGLQLRAGEDYQVISFSFDETEPAELARRSRDTYYAAMRNQYPDRAWRFLTGDSDAIRQLTEAAGYRFQRTNQEFLHPVVFFVVSPQGQIVRYLHGTHVVPKDLTLALYEAREGHVGTTIRKVVQYCFSFDPEQKTYVFNLLRVCATAILATLAIFAVYLMWSGSKTKKDRNL